MNNVEATIENSGQQRTVPAAWRPVMAEIVAGFAAGDFELREGLAGVAPVLHATTSRIRHSVQSNGATIVAPPEETWDTSVCIWSGAHWDVLVDLWTSEEGRSDQVMHAHVDTSGIVSVYAVYVP